MIRKILHEKNMSIYKLSEVSKVPYTTLNELINGKKSVQDCKIKTIECIAVALNITIENLLHILNHKSVTLSTSWEDNKNKHFYFPVIIENKNYECAKIHPLKQKLVNKIYNYISTNNIIEKVIIFGSSTNIRCNKISDIDMAIKLKDDLFTKINQNTISEDIQKICEYNCDIVWLNNLDKDTKLYNNINTKGVVIYE